MIQTTQDPQQRAHDIAIKEANRQVMLEGSNAVWLPVYLQQFEQALRELSIPECGDQ